MMGTFGAAPRQTAQIVFGLMLASAAANVFSRELPLPTQPQDALVGAVVQITARYEDTLLDVARAHSLGYDEVIAANPNVDPWLPGEGAGILIPASFVLPDAPRTGVVLNLAEPRLYYYTRRSKNADPVVQTFPVSIGRDGWETPLGTTRVVNKLKDPAWYPPLSIRQEYAKKGEVLASIVPPGPDNPLGQYALRLGMPGILIHGTNRPFSIGMRVSHGCLRLYPEDIEQLFGAVPAGTVVNIVNQPYKAGWHGDELYLEVHGGDPSEKQKAPVDSERLKQVLLKALEMRPGYAADWHQALAIAEAASGVPQSVRVALQAAEAKTGEGD